MIDRSKKDAGIAGRDASREIPWPDISFHNGGFRRKAHSFNGMTGREAVLSSQIEGTQSTLSDRLRFEREAQAGQPIDGIRKVSNYVDEVTGRKRGRVFCYRRYLAILGEGTDPLPPTG